MVSTSSADLESAYNARLETVRRYELEWWLDDAWVRDAVAADPGLADEIVTLARTRLVQTADIHKRPAWSTKRAALHAALLSAANTPGRPAAPVAAVLTIGLPASGKSSTLRRVAAAWASRAIDAALDADELRIRLPEYRRGLGSTVVQDETTELTYGHLYERVLDGPAAAFPLLVVDTVGDPAYLPATARRLARAGWPVAALVAELPLDEAIRRAHLRTLAEGRVVDDEYLRSRDGVPAEGLAALRAQGLLSAGWAVLDTSGPKHVPPPVVDGDGTFGDAGEPTPYW